MNQAEYEKYLTDSSNNYLQATKELNQIGGGGTFGYRPDDPNRESVHNFGFIPYGSPIVNELRPRETELGPSGPTTSVTNNPIPEQYRAAYDAALAKQQSFAEGNSKAAIYFAPQDNSLLGSVGNLVGKAGEAFNTTVSSALDHPLQTLALVAAAVYAPTLLSSLGEVAPAVASSAANTVAADAASSALLGTDFAAGTIGAQSAASGVAAAGAQVASSIAPIASNLSSYLQPFISSSTLERIGVQAGIGAISGQSPSQILRSAALNFIGGGVAGNVSGALSGTLGSTAANVLGQGAGALATGRDPTQALISGGIGAGVSAITGSIDGFNSLSPFAQRALNGSISSALIGGQTPTNIINAARSSGYFNQSQPQGQQGSPSNSQNSNQSSSSNGSSGLGSSLGNIASGIAGAFGFGGSNGGNTSNPTTPAGTQDQSNFSNFLNKLNQSNQPQNNSVASNQQTNGITKSPFTINSPLSLFTGASRNSPSILQDITANNQPSSTMDNYAVNNLSQSPIAPNYESNIGNQNNYTGYAKGGQVVGVGGLAHGGEVAKYHPDAPKGHHPEFISGESDQYVRGRGTGQSDDVPSMLRDGDYVVDADVVSALGDGSSKAGAEALAEMKDIIRNSITKVKETIPGKFIPAKIADGEVVLPGSVVDNIGNGNNAMGAKTLDKMREEIRAHKRGASINKIPPKARSPLAYIKMAQKG